MHRQVRLPERLAFAVVTASAMICATFFITHRYAAGVDDNTWTISAYFPSHDIHAGVSRDGVTDCRGGRARPGRRWGMLDRVR